MEVWPKKRLHRFLFWLLQSLDYDRCINEPHVEFLEGIDNKVRHVSFPHMWITSLRRWDLISVSYSYWDRSDLLKLVLEWLTTGEHTFIKYLNAVTITYMGKSLSWIEKNNCLSSWFYIKVLYLIHLKCMFDVLYLINNKTFTYIGLET